MAAPHPGTQITVVDLATGDTETVTIRDAWLVVCDGTYYVDGEAHYSNGTAVITVKTGAVIAPPAPIAGVEARA